MRRVASSLGAWLARLRGLLGAGERDGEFEDELQEHLRLLEERFAAQGMTRDEAAAAARRQFGNQLQLVEDRRGLQTFLSVEALVQDLRYALRTLGRSRGFAAVAVLTLGAGIGASTAIFSVIDNLLLSPFPYEGAGRMVFPRIQDSQQDQDVGRQGYTEAEVLEFAETNRVLDGLSAASSEPVLYRRGEGTEFLNGARVTPGTFEFFGMPALHGRALRSADYDRGAPPVFVLRHKTWISRFDGDPSILGRPFSLNGTSRTLVGIMPPRFGWYDADVYLPQELSREAKAPPSWFLVGRLKHGVSIPQAEADLSVIARRLAKVHPEDYPARFGVRVRTLGDSVVGRFETTLYTVLAAVGLLLLIACANVANLLLARGAAREKEFALRAALGAGRARLVRLLMVESLLLALAGAGLGVLVGWGGLKALIAALPPNLVPAEAVIELDAPVLLATLAVAVLTALAFGLAPALQAARRDVSDPLRDSGKGVGGGFGAGRLREAVVVAEVALSLMLLIGAGLLMRSFVALREVDLGVRADQVFRAYLLLPAERYKTPEQVAGFFRPLLARLQALPGAQGAARAGAIPPSNGLESRLEVAGQTQTSEWRTLVQPVSEQYFQVLGIPFKAGRGFDAAEVDRARKVAVVNETFARRFLSGGPSPIGRRVRLEKLARGSPGDGWLEVVGVAGDVRNRMLLSPVEPEVWVPATLGGSETPFLLMRASQDPKALATAVGREVWAADAGVAMAYAGTLEELLHERVYAGPRLGFLLMAIFGGIGLILVTVGVYSVLAYAMAQRTHEIGIRMALGAERADVLGLVLRRGLRLVLSGLALGLLVSVALGRLIAAELVGVTAHDPATLAGTMLLLTLTGAVACLIPARRAARVDPAVALRCE